MDDVTSNVYPALDLGVGDAPRAPTHGAAGAAGVEGVYASPSAPDDTLPPGTYSRCT